MTKYERRAWTLNEEKLLQELQLKGENSIAIAKRLGRKVGSVETKIARMRKENGFVPVPTSTMPKYESPLHSKGDALILSDVEAPFHHADFINRSLELADAWGIRTLHLNGDLLHFDNLSAWGAEWIPDDTAPLYEALQDFILNLPKTHRERGISMLENAGAFGGGGGLADELAEARKMFRSFSNFDEILVALGNHDDRYLRALDMALKPKELLVQLDRHHDERWKIAPYYYTVLETDLGDFRLEHPRSSGRTAAIDLCAQFHTNIIMGHSHRWAVNRDLSGKYWAIQSGHCVDETRLAYVMQRSAKRDAHCLGSVIVRDGIPWVLGEWTPWERMKKM